MNIPQYNIPANAQSAAAQQMMASQQKQAQLFKGGASIQSPNMGGNSQSQATADSLTKLMVNQYSQAANDQRYMGGKKKRITNRRNKRVNITRKRRNRKGVITKKRGGVYKIASKNRRIKSRYI